MSESKPIGYFSEKGKKKPVHERKSSKGFNSPGRVRTAFQGRSIFFDPKYKKYADMVSIKDPHSASESAKALLEEFREAKTREKRARIKSCTVLAGNRAEAMLNKKNLSPEERYELKTISAIYKTASNMMDLDNPPSQANIDQFLHTQGEYVPPRGTGRKIGSAKKPTGPEGKLTEEERRKRHNTRELP